MDLCLPIRDLGAAIRLVKPHRHDPNYVQLTAVDGTDPGLRLTLASRYTTTQMSIAADVTTAGAVTVPYKDFAAAVKGKGDIVLRSDGHILEAQNGLTNRIVATGEVNPELPDEPVTAHYPLDVDAIGDVLAATSVDDARPTLCSVYLNGRDVVATDSYRLHIARLDSDAYQGPPTLIPRPIATVLARMGGTGGIGFAANTTVVGAGNYVCRFHYNVSGYPKYEQLIPTATAIALYGRLSFDPTFAQVLKKLPGKKEKPVRLEPGSPLTLSILDGDNSVNGQVAGSLDGDATVGFNPGYLADLVTNTAATTLRVHPLKPAVLRARAERWEQIRLLMPVRLG